MKHAILIFAICGVGSLALAQSQPASQGAADLAPAVDDLTHSAVSLVHSAPGKPQRAGRLVLDLQFAYRLDPKDAKVNELLTGIYEIQGKLEQAAAAAQVQLAANPEDYVVGLTYLRLQLATLSNAQGRLDFLHQQATNAKWSAALRAQAYAQAGRILMGRDDKKNALVDFDAALALDPYLGIALAGKLSLRSDATDVDRTEALLNMVKGNPVDASAMWDLGTLLDNLGLYNDSLLFLTTSWQILAQRDFDGLMRNPTLAVQYFNAMLDAGQYRQAVEVFSPIVKKLGETPELLSLLAEAYRGVGDDAKSRELIGQVQNALSNDEINTKDSTVTAKQTAWYYLVNDFRVYATLSYAKAAAANPDNAGDDMELILGAAELKAEQGATGEKRLLKLADKDIYANAFLAEYYYATNQPERGKAALLAGAKLSHYGRAYRRILALARRQNIELPLAPGADQAQAKVKAFDKRYLDMALTPHRFIEVNVEPVKTVFAPMESILLNVSIKNTSDLDLSMGPEGLVNPSVGLEASAVDNMKDNFSNLPLANLPSDRYLRSGQRIETQVRIDVGELAQYLKRKPFSNIVLSVMPILDPVPGVAGVRSSLPSFVMGKVSMVRADILGEFDRTQADWQNQYMLALAYIVRDFRQGQVADRLLAARKVASLLTYYSELENNKASLPKPLTTKVKQPVLLAMLRAVLQDPSAAVRSEMIVALDGCPVDGRMERLLLAMAQDDSPLVRYRLCELLGISNVPNLKAYMASFAKDPDPLVQKMSSLFSK